AVPFLLRMPRPLAFLVGALVFAPVLDGFASGQNALFTLLLFALGFHCWTAGRGWMAGGVLALIAVHKPHLLIGPGLLFLLDLRRDARPLIALVLGVAVIAGLDLLVFPDETWAFIDWGRSVVAGRAPVWSQLRPGGEMTVSAFFQLLLPAAPGPARALTWGTHGFALLAFVGLHRRLKPQRDRSRAPSPWADRTMFAAAALLSLWLAPHAHLYEWTLLLVPAGLLWRDDQQRACLLPVFLVFAALTPLCVRLARLQLTAFEAAVHPSLPLLLLASLSIAFAARARLQRIRARS
ncbi:MAG TPA: glycosyltransferase 87 family protein, partial [Polyangia bacterium]